MKKQTEEMQILEQISKIETPNDDPICKRFVKIDALHKQFKKEPSLILYFKTHFVPPNKKDIGLESILFTLEYYTILAELRKILPTSPRSIKPLYERLTENMKKFVDVSLKDVLSTLVKNKIIYLDRSTNEYHPTKYYDMILVLFEKYLEARKYYFEHVNVSEVPIFEVHNFSKAQLLRYLIEWIFIIWLIQTTDKNEFSWTELNQKWKEFNKKQMMPRNYKTDLKYINLILRIKAFERNPKNRKYIINKEFVLNSGRFLYNFSIHSEIIKLLSEINAYFPPHFYRIFFGRCVDEFIFGPEAIKATYQYLEPIRSLVLVTPIIIWEHSESPLLEVLKYNAKFEIILYYVPRKGSSSDQFVKHLIKNGTVVRVCLEENINYPSIALIDNERVQIRPLNIRTDSMTPLGFLYSTDKVLVEKLSKEIEGLRERSYDYEYIQKIFENLYKYCIKGKTSYVLNKKQRQFLIDKGILTEEKLKLTPYGELLISRYY